MEALFITNREVNHYTTPYFDYIPTTPMHETLFMCRLFSTIERSINSAQANMTFATFQ